MTERLLLSGLWLKSLVLFSALLALEVHRFLGEANRFPKFSCGSFVASPSGKCLLHTLWKSLMSSSMSSRASSHRPCLGSFCGNLCSDTLLSFCLVLPHTIHRSPGMSGSAMNSRIVSGALTRSYSFSLYRLNKVYGNTGPYIATISCCFLYCSLWALSLHKYSGCNVLFNNNNYIL